MNANINTKLLALLMLLRCPLILSFFLVCLFSVRLYQSVRHPIQQRDDGDDDDEEDEDGRVLLRRLVASYEPWFLYSF